MSRRAPVQADANHPPGSITWDEHLKAWRAYAARWRNDQDAERIAARGGFGYDELTKLLGAEPTTWVRR